METCTPRPNISIRSAHSVPNLYFEVNRTFESSLKNVEAILNECEETDIDYNCSNNNISTQEIEIVIPNDSCDDPFQRNAVRKSRKRYRAPAPPAAITQKTLPNTKYNRNRNTSLDLLIVKSESPYIDINTPESHKESDSAEFGLGDRSDGMRMSVLQRKTILEKQLKLRANIPVDETFQGSNSKSNGSERKHLTNNDSRIEHEGDQTTKSVDVQKEVKRPFIPPPPPPPKMPPVGQNTHHARQQR